METLRQTQTRLKNLPATEFIALYEKYFPKDNLKSVSSKQALIDLSEKIHEENIDNTIEVENDNTQIVKNDEAKIIQHVEGISKMNTECLLTLKEVKEFLYENRNSLNSKGIKLYEAVKILTEKYK